MDQFSFRIHEKDILVYRSVYAPVNSNMFCILSEKEAVVFDPNENNELLSLFERRKIEYVHILLTHEHYDHITGVNWLKTTTNADVYCQKNCARVMSTRRGNNPALVALVLAQQDKQDGGCRYQKFRNSYKSFTIKADKTFDQVDNFTIGALEFKVRYTPGHSEGSACYILNDRLVFTGDSLLKDDVILRFPGGNKEDYKNIALPYLRSLDKNLIVMPGHGDPFALSETKNI